MNDTWTYKDFINEPLYNYRVTIVMTDGTKLSTGCLAHSTWHAVDKKFTELFNAQPDRTKYKAERKFEGMFGVHPNLTTGHA